MPDQGFGERECFANKASHALAQREIEAFDVIGFSFLFAARLMLIVRNDLLVSVPKVAVALERLVSRWYFVPQRQATHFIALPKVPGYDLTRATTQSNPDPNLVLLVPNVTPQFVQLQYII